MIVMAVVNDMDIVDVNCTKVHVPCLVFQLSCFCLCIGPSKHWPANVSVIVCLCTSFIPLQVGLNVCSDDLVLRMV